RSRGTHDGLRRQRDPVRALRAGDQRHPARPVPVLVPRRAAPLSGASSSPTDLMKTRRPLAAGALLTVLSLAACGAPVEATPTASATPTPDAPTMSATAAPVEETAAPAPGTPTCETIISAGTVDALKSQGWTFEQREFRIGDVIVDDGLECMWADYSTAS